MRIPLPHVVQGAEDDALRGDERGGGQKVRAGKGGGFGAASHAERRVREHLKGGDVTVRAPRMHAKYGT